MKNANVILDKNTYKQSCLNLPFDAALFHLKEYGVSNSVPIMGDESIALLRTILLAKQPQTILEIGSAIGYSASWMAKTVKAHITTIERNPELIELCRENIKKQGLEPQIKLIAGDALTSFDAVKDQKFDIIFIDAGKAQYEHFFEIYTPLLKEQGLVISDNLYFHDLLFEEELNSRQLKGLVKKISRYNQFLLDRIDFDTTILNIGDGIGLSYKK